MGSLSLSDIEFQRLGRDDDLRFILLAETTVSEDRGMSMYQDCANVIGVITHEEFRRMLLRAIQVAAGFDPLFAALLGDDQDVHLLDDGDTEAAPSRDGEESEE